MSNIIKSLIDNFDVNLLDTYERVLYNELRRTYPHRLSIIKLASNKSEQSYYLAELKELINQYDLTL